MQNSKLTLNKNNDKEILLVIAGYVSVYRLLQTYGYDRKDSSWQRFLKSNLTEKYAIHCYLWQWNKTDLL